jgi:FtsP/CotA-like multicopper oxidase with cupredoxin domain
MTKNKFLNLLISTLVVSSFLFGGIGNLRASAQVKDSQAPQIKEEPNQVPSSSLPQREQPQTRITPEERQAAADHAAEFGLKPGIASPVKMKAEVLKPGTNNIPALTLPDPSVVPHYFGPYANYANSPLPTGFINTIEILDGGTDYSAPVVIIADVYGTGTGASATAIINGSVTDIAVENQGTGYSSATIDISGGGGTGATATATVSPDVLSSIAVENPGSGYTSATVDITGGGGMGATATATVTTDIVSGITVVDAGSGYTSATVDITGGGGTGATATATIDAGAITGITVTDPGTGYTSTPTVTITGDGTGATASATVSGSVTGFTVTDPGTGYAFAPVVTVNGDGTGATAIASVAGAITGITITDPGLGYTSTPTITITGDGTGATASATVLGPINSITVDTPGSGYSAPIVTITDATGVNAIAEPKMGGITGGLRKFVDSLPGLNYDGRNNLNNYIPIAIADTSTYPGADYYEIELGQYIQQLHSDLPPTTLRGYRQTNTSDPTVSGFHYLGPIIIARRDVPVRIKFTNSLPTGMDGDLFLPVDTTVMGAGMGPTGEMYTQNRATLHLHGGLVPWISDGTPHQWTTPAGESTAYPKGVSVQNVPDMPDPGDGSLTFYYNNQQSARLMFYHDHSYGITRLNVYAGEAAGYVLTDNVEQDLINGTNVSGVNPGLLRILPDVGIPLIFQDKTFVDETTILAQDPTWKWGTGLVDPLTGQRAPKTGDLWVSSVYMPAQNPWDLTGSNAFGRWMYGPWFNPPTANISNPPVPNPYYDPLCDPNVTWCEPPYQPDMPSPSVGMEAFNDTPLVNGAAYPYLDVQPKAYRFRVLSAANDRAMNLQLYIAVDANGVKCDAANPTPAVGPSGVPCTEVKMVPALKTAGYPATWSTDGRPGGVPDPANMGPSWIQIGTEGGFLPAPVVIPPQPINWNNSPLAFNFGNVTDHSLLLLAAERADVIVDFSKYAGKTLIVYNDAPAAFPASDPRYDYYTGDPSQMDTGGAPTTQPGYGPNTRTVMMIRVANTTPAPAYNVNTLKTVFAKGTGTSTKRGVFEVSQDAPIVPQAAYNSAYNANFPGSASGAYVQISDTSKTFTPVGSTTPVTINFQYKAMHDEMGAAYDNVYGRMNSMLGVDVPGANALTQNIVLSGYASSPVDLMQDSMAPIGTLGDGTQIWRIMHNGVDSHPIHFHLFNVQLINRVAWDGALLPPEPNELGWKDTIRVNPLEDTIIAMRPVAPTQPFDVPNSIRMIDPTMPDGALLMGGGPQGFITPGLAAVTVYNHEVNFGWEYVWHCHILSHEEMDMMHSLAFAVKPKAPANLRAIWLDGSGSIELSWNDTSVNETSFTVERALSPGGPWISIANVPSDATGPTMGSITYSDTSAVGGTVYFYRVVATNTIGDTFVYAGGAQYPTKSVKSDYSNTAGATVNVVAVVRESSNPTNAASVDYVVTFSEPVTGVDTVTFSDFVLTTTGITDASITSVTGADSTYTVTINTGTSDGTIRLDVIDHDTIMSIATGTPLGDVNPGNGDFTTGEVYTIDKTAPTVLSILRASTNPTKALSVNFTVTFSESVTGVDPADFDFTASGITGATVASVTPVSGTIYTVAVNTGTGDGTLRLNIKGTPTIQDLATNALSGPYLGGASYTFDKTRPIVNSIAVASPNPSGATSVDFTVTFSEIVVGVNTADFSLTATGVTGTSITSVTPVSGTIYTVTVNTGAGNGTLRLNIANTPTVQDMVGNALLGPYLLGDVYTIDKLPTLVVSPATGTYGGTSSLMATLTSTGGIGLTGKTISFSVNGGPTVTAVTNASGIANVPTASLAGINAGVYPTGISASFAGDATYGAVSNTGSLTVAQASQIITVNTAAPVLSAYNSNFTVAATASSGLPVTYTATGVCTNIGADFTMNSGTGICTVHYNQPGDINYSAASEVTQNTIAQKLNQTIAVVTSAPATAAYNSSFTVAATASSGLPVFYSASGVCTVDIDTYTMTSGTGTCFIHYSEAGNANYNAAVRVIETTTAQKINQTITVGTSAPLNAVYNSSFSVSATASSGLSVTYSATGICSNLSAKFTMTSGTGTCNIHYNQTGNTNYNVAPEVTEDTIAQKASQVITVGIHAPLGAAYNSTFTVAATGGASLNPINYSATGVCSNVGPDFTTTSGTGTCTVHYNQAGDINYSAAPEVTEATTAQKINQTIAVGTSAPLNAAYNSSFTVAATSSSALPVIYSATGVCSNLAADFTMNSGTGTCTVHYNQPGDANYNSAVEVTQATTAQKIYQTIAVGTSAPLNAAYNSSFTVAATSSSALPVTYSATGVCSNLAADFTMNSGTGTCTVHYNQPGDANYNSAVEVTQATTAQKIYQTIAVGTSAPLNAAYNSSFTVAATSSSALPVTYSATGVCSNLAADFTMNSGTGTCTVHYNQPGDTNYNAAPEVTENTSATKLSQSITVSIHAPESAAYGSTVTVAATGGASGNLVTYSATGVCSNLAADFTMTSGTGACIVHYNQSGDANYNAATEVTETVTAQKIGSTTAITFNSPDPSRPGQAVTINFNVSSTFGIPTGNVTISDGVDVCTGTALTGTCALILTTTGVRTLTATYAGDANFNSSVDTMAHTVDGTPPSVVSITLANPNPTNSASIDFTVTFSEPVTGVGSAAPFNNFGLAPVGITGASITSITPVSGTIYTVSVNTGTGNGTIRLDVVDNDSILDAAGNPLGGPGLGNGNYITGDTYTIDKTSPSVNSIVRVSLNPANAISVDFKVTFSEPVTGIDTGDFSLTTVGSIKGAVVTSISGSGATRNVTVTISTGNGTLRLDIPNTATISDLAGNPLAGLPYTIGQTYIIVQQATFSSEAVNDGWILEANQTINAGGTLNSTAPTFNLGDDAANRQYRSILHFNTATLPNSAVITKVTLKILKQGLVGTNPFASLGGLRVDINNPFFGANANLAASDFQAAANTVAATFGTRPVGNWYSALLNTTGISFINLTGTTQFRLYFALGDNNNNVADYMKFFSGDYATISSRPTLLIEYYVP